MFLDEFARHGGPPEQPRREPIASSKGYPAVRDPAAEQPHGALNDKLDDASVRRMRQHYAPAPKL